MTPTWWQRVMRWYINWRYPHRFDGVEQWFPENDPPIDGETP